MFYVTFFCEVCLLFEIIQMMRKPWDKIIHGSMNFQQKNPWQNDQIQAERGHMY